MADSCKYIAEKSNIWRRLREWRNAESCPVSGLRMTEKHGRFRGLGLHAVPYTVYGRMITAYWRLRFDRIRTVSRNFPRLTVRYGHLYGRTPVLYGYGYIFQSSNNLKYFQGNKKVLESLRVEIQALSSSTSRYPSSRRNIHDTPHRVLISCSALRNLAAQFQTKNFLSNV